MTDKIATTPQFFVDMVVNYRVAKVTLVGHQLGVFRALAKGSATSPELARELKTDERATLLLLRALVAIGLCVLEGERFSNSALATAHLVPGAPGYMGSNLTYQELLWEGWSSLENIVRTGKPQAGLIDFLTRGPPNFSEEYLRSVETVSLNAAEEIATLAASWSPTRFLDIGGGLATYARAMARAHAALKATVLDLPSTLVLTAKALANAPEAARITLTPCNYLNDSFGEGFDLALLSHVTHDESFKTNQQLAQKAYAALVPGGRLLIHDFVVDRSGTEPLFSTMFSVNMLVYTSGGQVYSTEEYERMLRAAGFRSVEVRTVAAQRSRHPTTLVIGTK